MKRTCLFTKSAGEKLPSDPIESAAKAGVTKTSGSVLDIDTSGSIFGGGSSSSNWFTKNRDIIGASIAGLGSGTLLTGYILKKMHDKEIKKLKLENKKQNEEK